MFITDLCAPVLSGHDVLPARLKSNSLSHRGILAVFDKSTHDVPESLLAYMRETTKTIAAADVHISVVGFSL